MTFIKVKTVDGPTILINPALITYLHVYNDETFVQFSGSDDYVKIAVSFDVFCHTLEFIADVNIKDLS